MLYIFEGFSLVQIQTNVHRIAELLAVSDDEAFRFYSEVKQRFQPIAPVYVVLKNIYQYLQENNSRKPTSLEIINFIAEHGTEFKLKIDDVKPKQEEMILPAFAKPAEVVVLNSYTPSVEPELDWALKSRLEFSRRLNKAYDEIVGEYCLQNLSIGLIRQARSLHDTN